MGDRGGSGTRAGPHNAAGQARVGQLGGRGEGTSGSGVGMNEVIECSD